MTQQTKKLRLVPLALAALLIVLGLFVYGRMRGAQNPSDPQREPAPTESQQPTFDKRKHSTDDPMSIWVVVNKSRPLQPLSFAPTDLVDAGNGQQMRQEAAAALQEMLQAATADGMNLQPLSGYRSYQTQQTVYQREVETYGQAVADTQSARPGHSEHQTGLSMDLGGSGCGIEDCFGDTAEGKWVAAHAHTFGFIIRYPEGKDAITGYRYEPWHIRYVGKELAAEMHRTSIQTLEEFFDL